MRNQIVEGEPGIFPDPIARVMRALANLFRRERAQEPDTEAPAELSGENDEPPPPA
jgi:hypothetical protein